MAAKKGTAAWRREYREVIVGVHSATKSVRRVYVQNDGTMSGGFSHHPLPGRTAEHEAVVVYDLSKVQSFPLFLQQAADDYAEKLRLELASEE